MGSPSIRNIGRNQMKVDLCPIHSKSAQNQISRWNSPVEFQDCRWGTLSHGCCQHVDCLLKSMGRFTNVTCGCQEISSVSPCLKFLPTTYTGAHFQHLLGRLFPSLPSLALSSISDRWTADIKKWNKNKNSEIGYLIEVEKLCIMLCPPASWTKEMDYWLWVTVRVIRTLTVEVFFGMFQVIKVIMNSERMQCIWSL